MKDQPASNAPLAAGLPLIQGRCPACGTKGLFLGDGGYITCSLIDCPQPDAATEVIADFWDARQHNAFTFCAQSVGHVTMAEFAKKITEKVTAVAQRAEAVRYANEQKQRAEAVEAALAGMAQMIRQERDDANIPGSPATPDFIRGMSHAAELVDDALAPAEEAAP